MIGAIIGDIAGSAYEFNAVKSKDIELFPANAKFTDDTVLTIAVAEAIMDQKSYRDAIIRWGRKYPDESYGNRFRAFLAAKDPLPYNSYGNGSAMRVSPVGWAFDTEDRVLEEAKRSAEISHNHPEGIKGAQAVALAIFLGRNHASKEDIRREITGRFGYDLRRGLDDVRKSCRFDETCQVSVPEAIIAFLESTDFEDAIRNAISLGGDADTQAAITGSIAEAFYGSVPEALWEKAVFFLNEEIMGVVGRWMRF
jgi:ADP-ribosylglycohydrolase